MRGFTDAERGALNRNQPEPLYHQLFLVLKRKIETGELRFGSRLPGEAELAEFFDVSRITSKRALDELAAQGIISRRRGLGSHVSYREAPKLLQAPLISMIDSLALIGRETSIRLLDFGRVPPPPQVADALGLAPGEMTDRAIRVRSSEGLPFAHYTSWTVPLGPVFCAENLRQNSRMDLFRRIGLDLSELEQTLSAEAADGTIADQLEVSLGTPLLLITRVTRDQRGRAFDYLRALYRSDRFQYHMKMSAKDLVVRAFR
jgi:GntR family transcriptional regulator